MSFFKSDTGAKILQIYSGVRLIAIWLLFVPKRAFNVNFVPLIASSPTSKQISCKMRIAIKRTPLYFDQ